MTDNPSNGFFIGADGKINGYAISVIPWELITKTSFAPFPAPVDVGAPEIPSLLAKDGLKGVGVVFEYLGGSDWKQGRATESYLADMLGAYVYSLEAPSGMALFLGAGRAAIVLVGSKEIADAIYAHAFWADGNQRPYVYELKNGVPSLYLTPDSDVPGEPGSFEGDADADHFDVSDDPVTIDGKEGTDTVAYAGKRDDFDIKLDAGGTISVTKPGGTDVLISIERVGFSDGALLFDIDSVNGPAAYRLYGGAFDRTPDEDGLLFWIDYLDSGGTLHAAAAGFIASAEFAALHGANLSDAGFIDQLYLNVLGRPGEQAGADFWKAYLDNGGDRASALVSFTQLPEYAGISQANIENGYWVA